MNSHSTLDVRTDSLCFWKDDVCTTRFANNGMLEEYPSISWAYCYNLTTTIQTVVVDNVSYTIPAGVGAAPNTVPAISVISGGVQYPMPPHSDATCPNFGPYKTSHDSPQFYKFTGRILRFGNLRHLIVDEFGAPSINKAGGAPDGMANGIDYALRFTIPIDPEDIPNTGCSQMVPFRPNQYHLPLLDGVTPGPFVTGGTLAKEVAEGQPITPVTNAPFYGDPADITTGQHTFSTVQRMLGMCTIIPWHATINGVANQSCMVIQINPFLGFTGISAGNTTSAPDASGSIVVTGAVTAVASTPDIAGTMPAGWYAYFGWDKVVVPYEGNNVNWPTVN
jgi:hypothetical protein